MTTIKSTVSNWPGIEVKLHRFNAQEFTLAGREIGHLHNGRLLDVPFATRVRDVIIEKGRAEKHHVSPDFGVSYRIHSDEDVNGALWLLRVSYLYNLIGMRKREEHHSEIDGVDVDAALTELDLSDELYDVFSEMRAAG